MANFISDIAQGGPNLLTQDLIQFGIIAPQWGLFSRRGKPVIIADNVLSVEYKQESSIADYPIEKGGFESYDKVGTPFAIKLSFSSGGSFANRQRLLDSINLIADNLTLYDVITPEATYTSVSIMHWDYTRAEGHIGLIKVNVWVQEIRIVVPAAVTSTQSAPGYSNGSTDSAGASGTGGTTSTTGAAGTPDPTNPGGTGGSSITDPTNPGSTDPVYTGQTQTTPPTPAQKGVVTDYIAPSGTMVA